MHSSTGLMYISAEHCLDTMNYWSLQETVHLTIGRFYQQAIQNGLSCQLRKQIWNSIRSLKYIRHWGLRNGCTSVWYSVTRCLETFGKLRTGDDRRAVTSADNLSEDPDIQLLMAVEKIERASVPENLLIQNLMTFWSQLFFTLTPDFRMISKHSGLNHFPSELLNYHKLNCSL